MLDTDLSLSTKHTYSTFTMSSDMFLGGVKGKLKKQEETHRNMRKTQVDLRTSPRQ